MVCDYCITVGPGVVKIKLTHFNRCVTPLSHRVSISLTLSPLRYALGDYVLFHPVMVNRTPNIIWNNLLHLDKPKPYVFLHPDCYKSFHIKHGKL